MAVPIKSRILSNFASNIRRCDFPAHSYTGDPARSAASTSREKENTFADLPNEIREWAQGSESGIANPAERTWSNASPGNEGEPKTGKEFFVTLSLQESASFLETTEAEESGSAGSTMAEVSRQRQFTLRRIGVSRPGATITYYVGDDAKTGVVFWCAVPVCH